MKATANFKLRITKAARIAMVVASFAGLCWAAYEAIFYLRTAPRFEVQKLSVSGLKRVTENEVLARAGFEIGTNVFSADLDEIRARVEELEWVRHAMVERILPDQIVIKVIEREPVGLARIRGELYQFDGAAVILNLDGAGASSFPILDGLRPDDPEGNLKKVEAYRKVLDELGQASLSEVHINQSGDVSVVSSSEPLVVNLGSGDFRNRWIKYLQLKTQIQQQYPQAMRVDLRFKNQVIVRMRDDEAGRNITWDVEKKTL
jgi:cell division protein FtsQ